MADSTLPIFITWLAWGLLWASLCFGLGAARAVTALRVLSLAALACAGYACILALPPWPVWAYALGLPEPTPTYVSAFAPPAIAWGVKLATIGWSLLVLGFGWTTAAEAGLRFPLPCTLRAVLPAILLLALGALVNAYLTRQTARTLWLHEGVYYATLPGVGEELFYRGILLGMLGRVFPRTIPLPGTRTSWGGIVSVLLFTLAHFLPFPTHFMYWVHSPVFGRYLASWLLSARFFPGESAYVLVMSTFFLWVRERTGSCWAAVATHCLMNGCLAIGSHFA